jgi:thioredoxin reductase (NADPH)
LTRPLKKLSEVAVIGGGLAGLAAARHAARLGRLVTLFEGSGIYGGQVATVDEVDGIPAPGHFSGQELAIGLLEEAQKIGVQVVERPVAELRAGARLLLTDEEGGRHRPEAVIVASGARLRRLGVPGEDELAGRGVSRCATCDGGFFRGQDVAVIGGGDAAVTEALVLAKLCREVIMVCRGPLKAKRAYIDRLDARDNVRFIWDAEVSAILGEAEVTGLRLRDVRNGAASELACAGVFPFIGVEPNSAFLPAALRSPSGRVTAGPDLATPDPRIFAAGAVREGYGGNIVEAMAEGVSAAEAAARLLSRGSTQRELVAA